MISIIKVIEKPNTPVAVKRENPIKSLNKKENDSSLTLLIPGFFLIYDIKPASPFNYLIIWINFLYGRSYFHKS